MRLDFCEKTEKYSYIATLDLVHGELIVDKMIRKILTNKVYICDEPDCQFAVIL